MGAVSEELNSVETESPNYVCDLIHQVSEELNSVETSLVFFHSSINFAVSEELNSVETGQVANDIRIGGGSFRRT